MAQKMRTTYPPGYWAPLWLMFAILAAAFLVFMLAAVVYGLVTGGEQRLIFMCLFGVLIYAWSTFTLFKLYAKSRAARRALTPAEE